MSIALFHQHPKNLAQWCIHILRALVGVEGLRLKVTLSYTVRATRDTISKRKHFKYYFRDEDFIEKLDLNKYRGTDHLKLESLCKNYLSDSPLCKIISKNDQKIALVNSIPTVAPFINSKFISSSSCSHLALNVFPKVLSTFSLLLEGSPWIPALILPAQFLSCSLNLIIYVVNYLCCSLNYLLSCW